MGTDQVTPEGASGATRSWGWLRGMRAAVSVVAALFATVLPAWAQAPPEAVEYYAADAVGSVRVVFDGAGNVLARASYLPFGEPLTESNPLPRQRFTGQERDGEAGLDYFNARSMQPRTGRFGRAGPAVHRRQHRSAGLEPVCVRPEQPPRAGGSDGFGL